MNLDSSYFAQYSALTHGVGFAALPDRTILALTGSDRTSFLNAFCTNNIKALQPGSGCEAFITSPQGKTLSHVLVFCEEGAVILDTSPGQAADLTGHFDKYVISEDVQFVDRTAEFVEILVAGPAAANVLRQLTGAELPGENLAHSTAIISGQTVIIIRTEYAGPDCYFVQAPLLAQAAMEQALSDAGAVRCESDSVESARLEAGFPLFGRDITADNLPQEIGRDSRAISFTKGCYLGQETVARIDALGHVNRQLVGLKFAGETVPAPGAALLVDGKEAGQVSSAAWSPLLSAPLAFALLRRKQARPGTQLISASGAAEVVSLPIASR